MDKDKIIISMTSYPPRIKYVSRIFSSILMTNVDKKLYHCVLVLSKDEFKSINSLPEDLQLLINNNLIELIWDNGNIKSHKKLIPTLNKYPNNPILIIDDDVIRNKAWLMAFINDHKKYPNDIICGAFYKKIKVTNKGITETYCKDDTYNTKKYFEKIMNLYKPANGTGGTLYPANTFTDPRFFDRNLFMKLAPTDDETWHYFFAVLNNKKFRQLSYEYKSENFIGESQKTALNKINDLNKVQSIHDKILKTFPEILDKLKQLSNK